MIKLVAEENGREYLLSVDSIGGANVVILDVDCNSDVFVGSVVRMDALAVAQNALADSLTNSNIIGVVEAKTSAVLCNIRVLGVSSSIFIGLDVTKEYYLSDVNAGFVTTTVPVITGHVKIKIGQPFSATEMLVLKGERTVRG